MNLDALKEGLRERLEEEANQLQKSDHDHLEILRHRANSLVDRIIRSLKIEMGLAALMAIVGLLLIVLGDTVLETVTGSVVAVICVVIGLYCIPIYQKLTKTNQEAHLSLSDYLSSSYSIVQRFVTFYIWYTFAMFPLGLATGFVVGYLKPDEGPDINNSLTVWGATIFMLILVGLTAWLSYWYINKMYRRHMLGLKACLAELQELNEQ